MTDFKHNFEKYVGFLTLFHFILFSLSKLSLEIIFYDLSTKKSF